MAKSRKLVMKKRESKQQINVSFTKRRQGLFSKAADLCMFCDAHVALLVSSPCSKHKVYSFGSISIDTILENFLSGGFPKTISTGTRMMTLSLSNKIKALDTEINRIVKNIKKTEVDIGERCPWLHLEGLLKSLKSIEELQALVDSLEKLKVQALSRLSYCSSVTFPIYSATRGMDVNVTPTKQMTSSITRDTESEQPYYPFLEQQRYTVGMNCKAVENEVNASAAYGYSSSQNNCFPASIVGGNKIISSEYNPNNLRPVNDKCNLGGYGNDMCDSQEILATMDISITQGMSSTFDAKMDLLQAAGTSCRGANNPPCFSFMRCHKDSILPTCNTWSKLESAHVPSSNGQHCNLGIDYSSLGTDPLMDQQIHAFVARGNLKDKETDRWTMTRSFSDLDYLSHQNGY